MTTFQILKYLHVVSVIAWVGGAIGLFVLQSRMRAAGDRAGLMSIGRQMEAFSKIYYSPAAAVTLITGIAMIATTDGYGFEEPFVVIGLLGIAVTMGIGLGMIGPTGRKMLAEADKAQPDPAAMTAYGDKIRALTVVTIVILLFVVWAMVVRPG